MNFAQPLYAKAQQASKIYTRSALTYKISILFRFDYSIEKFRIIGLFTRERLGFINKKRHDIAISCLFLLINPNLSRVNKPMILNFSIL